MAYITIPGRRLTSPKYPVQLKTEFRYDLMSFMSPLLVGTEDTRLLTYGTATRGQARGRVGWVFAEDAANVISNTDAGKNTTTCATGQTLLAHVTVGASTAAGAQAAIALGNASDHRIRLYFAEATKAVAASAFASALGQSVSANNVWDYGTPVSVGGVYAGVTSRTSYVNGVASTTNTTNSGTGTALTNFSYGLVMGATNTLPFDGTIHYGGWWRRQWSAAEIQELHEYPYMWAQEYRRPIYFVNSVAAASFNAAWANSANTMIQTPTT